MFFRNLEELYNMFEVKVLLVKKHCTAELVYNHTSYKLSVYHTFLSYELFRSISALCQIL